MNETARFVIGLGSSGPMAERHLEEAVLHVRRHPLWSVRAISPWFENPATGGVTHARFVNGAALLDTPLAPAALLRALHAIETRVGRVRGTPWAARALDLDLLIAVGPSVDLRMPTVPHPRLLQRPFALWPTIHVLEQADHVVPVALRSAARLTCPSARMIQARR